MNVHLTRTRAALAAAGLLLPSPLRPRTPPSTPARPSAAETPLRLAETSQVKGSYEITGPLRINDRERTLIKIRNPVAGELG
ncbi:hypothetical protein [Streptomyces nigrescens]|uniref:Uncharacterized protein n=1 Tax=Streptomyces nigrescens TaxID=1920 RepID=A0ABY7IXW5_STRNI|nr:hypothetical protein [Streptomyces nigrescens]WAU03811.1 hypothetical protein STRNI_002002 [Streptomyces nigrescens]